MLVVLHSLKYTQNVIKMQDLLMEATDRGVCAGGGKETQWKEKLHLLFTLSQNRTLLFNFLGKLEEKIAPALCSFSKQKSFV